MLSLKALTHSDQWLVIGEQQTPASHQMGLHVPPVWDLGLPTSMGLPGSDNGIPCRYQALAEGSWEQGLAGVGHSGDSRDLRQEGYSMALQKVFNLVPNGAWQVKISAVSLGRNCDVDKPLVSELQEVERTTVPLPTLIDRIHGDVDVNRDTVGHGATLMSHRV